MNENRFTNLTTEQTADVIVGIGASAGGIEALQEFFSHIEYQPNLAFIIVQHLPADTESHLADILTKSTGVAVTTAEHEMVVSGGQVYLIPPNMNMILQNGHLCLTPFQDGESKHPIDHFFCSLAKEMGHHSVGVILSGTGTDGVVGITAINEAHGLIVIQEISSAKFNGMPCSAIRTGLFDFVLPPCDMFREISNFSSFSANSALGSDLRFFNQTNQFNDEEILGKLYLLLKKYTGIDFSYYKKAGLLQTIEHRMIISQKNSIAAYATYLSEHPDEGVLLAKGILVPTTSFFRDANYFELLKQNTIYPILLSSNENIPIRVWVAGCSSGEEAYSIAILFDESMKELHLQRDLKIFATDVDASSVAIASKGIYPESIANDMSELRLQQYFVRNGASYQIIKKIRHNIIFSPHNIVQDAPFSRLDLICCRNVMNSFQPVLQKKVSLIFHNALKDSGFLFLGKEDTISDLPDVFVPVSSPGKIYVHQIVEVSRTKSTKTQTLFSSDFIIPNPFPTDFVLPPKEPSKESSTSIDFFYPQLLDSFMPPCVIIDPQNNIVHTFGDYETYFQLPRGKIILNIFHMVSNSLSLAISTALNKVRNEKKPTTYTDVVVSTKNGTLSLDLTVLPLYDRDGRQSHLTAVMLNNPSQRIISTNSEPYSLEQNVAQRIADLEQENTLSRNTLRTTIDEFEIVNVELQATNEELLITNGELQHSNEELQSLNEELHSVNREYQQKMEEVMDLNNDMLNVLSSTMIGMIFLDKAMNIRKFTGYIAQAFTLSEEDIGSSVKKISHYFEHIDLEKEAIEVLRTLLIVEHEVQSCSGKHYLLHISPYRTTDNSIQGTVITIVDLLERKDALTGLPNRSMFRSHLEEAITRAKAYEKQLAIMFLDIDNFKSINDTMGHDVGDLLLKEVSYRLSAQLRPSDYLARFGGDEFLILMGDVSSQNEIINFANGLLHAFDHPFVSGDIRQKISISIGVTSYPNGGTDYDTLIKGADVAMYKAKEFGKNTFKMFSNDFDSIYTS